MADSLEARYDRILERITRLEQLAASLHGADEVQQLAMGVQQLSVGDAAACAPGGGGEHIDDALSLPPEELDARNAVAGGSSPAVQQRLRAELLQRGLRLHKFVRAPQGYYQQELEFRRQVVGAASTFHLCKSIVMENTHAHPNVRGWEDPHNSRYYCVVVQYAYRLDTAKLDSFLHKLNGGRVAKKYFHMRLASDEVGQRLTGFGHNAVSPVGSRERLPIIIASTITQLRPDFFYLGGGEVDLKLGMRASEFVAAYGALVADITDVRKLAADVIE